MNEASKKKLYKALPFPKKDFQNESKFEKSSKPNRYKDCSKVINGLVSKLQSPYRYSY